MMIRVFVAPSLLLAVVAGYVVLNPSGASVANPDAEPSPETNAAPALPDGVSGRLTYRTGREHVTVRFPDLVEEQRYIPAVQPQDNLSSAHGWWVQQSCDLSCTISVRVGNQLVDEREVAGVLAQEWSPDRTAFAFAALTDDNRVQVFVIDGVTPSVRVLYEGDANEANVMALAWDDDRLLLSGHFRGANQLQRLALDGTLTPIAVLDGAPMYFYPSPDRSRFLFTQSAPDGWQLWMLDTTTDTVSSLGNMGSDAASASPPEQTGAETTVKGSPMYIAWSPDGSMVAFGGGYEAPYFMTTVHLDTGISFRTDFANGYPGEIRWTADSTNIAVSTYDIERTRHETWVVNPATGEGRHLMNGCVIVWSPDGRFLAVHAEDVAGISIIDVNTGERGQLTHKRDDAPLEWTE